MLETWLVKCLLLFIGLLICQSRRGRETIIDRLLTWQCCTQLEHWVGILHGIPALLWWCLYWAGSSMLCFLFFLFFVKLCCQTSDLIFFSFHIGKFVSGSSEWIFNKYNPKKPLRNLMLTWTNLTTWQFYLICTIALRQAPTLPHPRADWGSSAQRRTTQAWPRASGVT